MSGTYSMTSAQRRLVKKEETFKKLIGKMVTVRYKYHRGGIIYQTRIIQGFVENILHHALFIKDKQTLNSGPIAIIHLELRDIKIHPDHELLQWRIEYNV